MPAKLVSDNGRHIVIRPLVYVLESEARAYAQESKLPVIGCCCSACGDLSLKRQRMKRLITELELEHPDIKNSMITALGNVVPSHLIDTKVAAMTTAIRDERRAARTTPEAAPLKIIRPTVTAGG
jgi:tRNA 2-thiocytidine biosynthesis protein TtcA